MHAILHEHGPVRRFPVTGGDSGEFLRAGDLNPLPFPAN
jgi:hypothetical protein